MTSDSSVEVLERVNFGLDSDLKRFLAPHGSQNCPEPKGGARSADAHGYVSGTKVRHPCANHSVDVMDLLQKTPSHADH